jgi:CRP/FNR family transcriptional regulator, anaerobic regulatory protein
MSTRAPVRWGWRAPTPIQATTTDVSLNRCNHCLQQRDCALGDLREWVGSQTITNGFVKGQHVFRQADAFVGLYAVRCGVIKTYEITPQGAENITGFHLPGDVIGLDGLKDNHHLLAAVALERSTLCVLGEQQLFGAMRGSPHLCSKLLSLMSAAMDNDQQRARLMQHLRAEERLAAFILQLAERYGQRRLSTTRIRLPMSRTDIAGYLGLTLESVSRAFRRLADQRLIIADGRELQIIDAAALQRVA